MYQREEVTFSRNTEAIMIPSGERVLVPEGAQGTITQSLGGAYTLITERGLMVRVSGKEVEGGQYDIKIKMTLTAPGCGMGPVLGSDVKMKVESISGVRNADVEVVFDPVWDRSMMSDAAKLQLGMMW